MICLCLQGTFHNCAWFYIITSHISTNEIKSQSNSRHDRETITNSHKSDLTSVSSGMLTELKMIPLLLCFSKLDFRLHVVAMYVAVADICLYLLLLSFCNYTKCYMVVWVLFCCAVACRAELSFFSLCTWDMPTEQINHIFCELDLKWVEQEKHCRNLSLYLAWNWRRSTSSRKYAKGNAIPPSRPIVFVVVCINPMHINISVEVRVKLQERWWCRFQDIADIRCWFAF